jgi:hypothetical protein
LVPFPRFGMAHDRAEGDRFPMTQEFISMMLGVRRAGVSVAAAILQKAGVIGYRHGCITVLDRPGLEGSACECYGMVRQQFERLLGQASGQNLQLARGLYASGQTNSAPYRPLTVKASGTTAVLRDLEQSGGQQP